MEPNKVGTLQHIQMKDIFVNEENNCRGVITPISVHGLAQNIQDHGLQVPVIVRLTHEDDTHKKLKITEPYILVAGFRRHMAHRILERTTIEAIVRDMTRAEAAIVNFAENLERKDLSLMQEADAIWRFVRMGMTRQQICVACNKNITWVSPRIFLAQMDPAIQDLARDGVLTADDIRTLWSYADPEERFAMVRQIRDKRQQGFIGKIRIRKPKEPKNRRGLRKKQRGKEDIFNLQKHLADRGVPFGLHTRMLAWCSGEISDLDLGVDIQNFCSDMTRLANLTKENPTPSEIEQIYKTWGLAVPLFYSMPASGVPVPNEIDRVF